METLCKWQSLGQICCFRFSHQHVACVDLGIPSLDAKWVTGHREDLGMTDIFSTTDSLQLVSDGKIHKILKLPGVGSSSVTHQYAGYPVFAGDL